MKKIKFIRCDEFDKDFKHLSKKYKSLEKDFEDVLKVFNQVWINFPHIERINNLWNDIIIPVYKMRRVWCESLKKNSKLRIIFAYDEKSQEIKLIQFIEIYAKWESEVEDRERIRKYLAGKEKIEE